MHVSPLPYLHMVNYGSAAWPAVEKREESPLGKAAPSTPDQGRRCVEREKRPALQRVITLLSHFQVKHNSPELVHKPVLPQGVRKVSDARKQAVCRSFPVKKIFFSNFRGKSGKKSAQKKCGLLIRCFYNLLFFIYKIFFQPKPQKRGLKNDSREKKNKLGVFKNFL
ncbi:hypothetical protein [Mailhella sp.]|uniref:hypothetical protein n=1 Tax=Mailhella sp. TaxID=1981029 RepID=UPI004063C36C